MACLSSIIAMIIMLFYDTILTDRLIQEGISIDVVGKIASVLKCCRICYGVKLSCLCVFHTFYRMVSKQNPKNVCYTNSFWTCNDLFIAFWAVIIIRISRVIKHL